MIHHEAVNGRIWNALLRSVLPITLAIPIVCSCPNAFLLAGWNSDQKPSEVIVQQSSGRKHPFEKSAEEVAHHKVRIHEPDGSLAKQISILTLGSKIGAHVDLNSIDPALKKQVHQPDPEGLFELDLTNQEQFLFLQSEKGGLLLASARILATDDLELLAWSKLQVKILKNGQPVSDMKVSCGTAFTSDMLFRSPDLSITAVTNELGIAKFENIQPGESNVRINPQPVEYGGRKWEWNDQTRSVQTYPGERLEIAFGEGTGEVAGRFKMKDQLNDGLQEYWGAELEYVAPSENLGLKVRIKISPDGSFIASSAPPGEAKIMVRHPGTRSERGTVYYFPGVLESIKIDEFKGNKSERQNLGELQLNFAPIQFSAGIKALVEQAGDSLASKLPFEPNDDAFRSDSTVDFVARVKLEDKLHYGFFDDQGRMLRVPCQIPKAIGNLVSMDKKNQRIYLICDSPDSESRQELRTFDMNGRQINSLLLDDGAKYSVAADTKNNRIGLLKSKEGKSAFQLVRHDGYRQSVIVASSSTLCYSQSDDAFWLLGGNQVVKLDPSNFKTIASFEFPSKVSCSSAFPHMSGGIICIERVGSSLLSANRVWKIDSNGRMSGAMDLGSYSLSSGLVGIDLGLNLLFQDHKMTGSRSEKGTKTSVLLIDRNLKSLSRFDSLEDAHDGTAEKKGAWVLDGTMFKRVAVFENGLRTIDAKENREQAVSIVAQ